MTNQKPTEEQQSAIGLINRDLPVTAGAGSGKTFVLTHRFFQILAEQQADLPEILTITFTEKAANQMRHKIRDLIRRFAFGDIPENFPPVRREGLVLPDQQYWRGLLDKFDQSYISTIHGFCARVLRESGIWSGYDPDFSVMDEHITGLRQPEIVRKIVFRMIHEQDDAIDHLLQYFSVSQITRKLADVLRKRLQYNGLIEYYFNAEGEPRPVSQLLAETRSLFSDTVAPLLDKFHKHPLWQEIQSDILALEPANPNAESDNFYPHWTNIREFITRLNTTDDMIDQANVWIKLQDELKSKGRQSNWEGADFGTLKSNMKEFRENILEPELKKVPPFIPDIEREAISLAQSAAKIFQKIVTNYEEWKSRHNYLDYDDLLIKTVDMFESDPDILETYQNRFRHILIDEFQDTSPIQYRLAELLRTEESVNSSMFIVGDPKQSIYRFRGTEVSLFHEAEKALGDDKVVLDRSFRSQPALLEWIDCCFTDIMGTGQESQEPFARYEPYYLPLRAHREDIASPNHVTLIQLIECEKNAVNSSLENKLQIEAAHIANWIQNELREVQVQDGESMRSASYGDVAILFRRSGYMKHYEFALQSAGVPFYTVSGSGFFEKREILDLLNVLRALAFPEDDIALVGALRSHLFGLSDEGLYWLADTGIPWYNLVFEELHPEPSNFRKSDNEVFLLFKKKMNEWRQLVDTNTPDRLVERICTDTGYLGVLAKSSEGTQRVRNVEQFIEIAHEFSRTPQTTLRTFLDYVSSIREYSDIEEAPLHFGDQDAVQLITIHKAKGLEFPVVIVPNIDYPGHNQIQHDFYADYGWAWNWTDPRRPSQEQQVKPFLYKFIREVESNRDLAESKRLFYVASTRAKDYLFLSGVFDGPDGIAKLQEKVNYQKDNWLQWIIGIITERGWRPGEKNLEVGNNHVRINHYDYLNTERLPGITDIVSPDQQHPVREKKQTSWLSAEEIGRRWKISPQPPVLEELHPSMLPVFSRDKEEFYNTYIRKLPAPYTKAGTKAGHTGSAFGSLVHQILEVYVAQPDVDVDRLIETNIAGSIFAGDEEIKNELSDGIARFKQSQLYRKSRELHCATEVEFVTRIEGFILSGQIDLLMAGPDGHLVADYKTDTVPENNFNAKVEEYWLQLAAYAYGIQQSTGALPKEVILYFWKYGKEVVVPITPSRIEDLKEVIRDIRLFLSELSR